jgi:methionyl-tRNA formyltransferase
MNKHEVLIIAAATTRSLEYVKSIQGAGITIEEVLILDDGSFLPGQRDVDKGGLMSLKLNKFCSDHAIKKSTHPSNVNSDSLVRALIKSNANLAIYSGYGGQIVGHTVLSIGKFFLHIHSGALPEYRGSTTIYYAILNNDNCGVTAILLDNGIDTGLIVGEMAFPLPQSGSDIDFYLDVKFRSELLVDVVSYYVQHGEFKDEKPQLAHEGVAYYIMHPVLRHIAMLKLD